MGREWWPSMAEIDSAFADAQRNIRSRDRGLAARPKRDLQTSAWARPLRAAPWQARLAYQLAMQASGCDVGVGWNLQRLDARLHGPVDLTWLRCVGLADEHLREAGLHVPTRPTDRSVWRVSRFVLEAAAWTDPEYRVWACSLFPPAGVDLAAAVVDVLAAVETANRRWFDANLARPFMDRATSTLAGAVSVATGGDAYWEAVSTAVRARLEQDRFDGRARAWATLQVDLDAAGRRMRAQAIACASTSEGSGGSVSPQQSYRLAVLDAALQAVTTLAGGGTREALEHGIDDAGARPSDGGGTQSPFIRKAAQAVARPQPSTVDTEAAHYHEACFYDDVAAELLTALGL